MNERALELSRQLLRQIARTQLRTCHCIYHVCFDCQAARELLDLAETPERFLTPDVPDVRERAGGRAH